MRVLYVGGWGRSGSTLLDRMLGQLPGFCSLGEVREIWRHGIAENRPCGCGRPFLACPFWLAVGQRAFGGWDRLDLDEVLRLRYTLDRAWSVPMLLRSRTRLDAASAHARYLDILAELYRAVGEVSGADVMIDSSKLPSHALLLRRVPGVDLRMIHLVRDSRGVAYSWKKHVRNQVTSAGAKYMQRYGPVSASLRYVLYNLLTALMGPIGVPYLRVRYEDFAREPGRGVRAIAGHAGLADDVADVDFIEQNHTRLLTNHTVDGNPMRLTVGDVKIRVDEDWKGHMGRLDRMVVTVLTSPLLIGYRYPLRASRSSRAGT